jgi:hypothetical protein
MAMNPIPPGYGAVEPEMFPPPEEGPLPPEALPELPPEMPPDVPMEMPGAEPTQALNPLAPPVGGDEITNPNMDYDDRQSPAQVGYDWGDCCGTCTHFMAPEGCALVNGHIRADGVCNLFEKRPGLPEDAVYGD